MRSQRGPTPPTLDLHGRGANDAVSDVTLFLERIRRTAINASPSEGKVSSGGGSDRLFVKIITGSGSVRTSELSLLHDKLSDY